MTVERQANFMSKSRTKDILDIFKMGFMKEKVDSQPQIMFMKEFSKKGKKTVTVNSFIRKRVLNFLEFLKMEYCKKRKLLVRYLN